jgi:hypothetical protein
MKKALRLAFESLKKTDWPTDDIRAYAIVAAAQECGEYDYAEFLYEKIDPAIRVKDRAGHRRLVYDGLARTIVSMFRGDRLREGVVRRILPAPPFTGENAAQVAKAALFAGIEDDVDTLRFLREQQQPSGSFLQLLQTDNPEPAWYHDLVILHGMAAGAILASSDPNDAYLFEPVKKAALYTLREVQPDHASAQPWALHAMLMHEETVPVADILLHAAGIQSPATMDGVSILLVADALRLLQIYENPN